MPRGSGWISLADGFGSFKGEFVFLGSIHFVVAIEELLIGLGRCVEDEGKGSDESEKEGDAESGHGVVSWCCVQKTVPIGMRSVPFCFISVLRG